MSFSLSNVNGIQMQRDSVLSSLSVACDATTVLPKNNLLYKEPRDGKAAISVDVCDLEVANLTVTDTLIAPNAQLTNLGLDTLDGRIINLKQSNGLALGPPKITIGESTGNDAVGLNTVIEILGATNGKTIALPDGGDIVLQKQGYGNLKIGFELVDYISSGKEQATLNTGTYYVGAPVTGNGGANPNAGLGTSANVDYRNGLQTFTTTPCGDAPPGYVSPASQGDLCVKLEMVVTTVNTVNTITSLKVLNVYLNGTPGTDALTQPVQGFQVGFNYRLVDSNGTANNCAAVLASNTAGDGPYSTLPNPVIIQLAAGSVVDVPSNEQGGTISGYRAEFQYISGTVPGLPPQWIPSLSDINTLTDDTLIPSTGVPLTVGALQIAANTNPGKSGRIIGKNFDDVTTTPGDTIIVDNTPLEMTSLVQQPINNPAPTQQGALQVLGGVYIGNNLQVIGVIGSAEAVFGNTTPAANSSLTVAELATFEGSPAINALNGMSTFQAATVSNLTDNRIVLAGNNGLLEDSPDLTFDGTLFSVGGSFSTNIISTETTMSSATVSDLSGVLGGLVLSGAGGSLTVSPSITFTGAIPNQELTLGNGASLTVDGTTTTGSATVVDLGTTGPGVVYTDAANPGQLKNSTNFVWDNGNQTLTINSQLTVTQNTKTQDATITSMALAGGVVYTDGNGQVFNNSDLIFSAGVTSSLIMTGNTTITGSLTAANGSVPLGPFFVNGATGNTSIASTTASSASSNGALVVAGGAGIGGDVYVGGTLNSFGVTQLATNGGLTTANGDFTSVGVTQLATNGGLTTASGDFTSVGVTQLATNGGLTTASGDFTSVGVATVSDTTVATSAVTAALKVAGGVGVEENLIIDSAGTSSTPTYLIAGDLTVSNRAFVVRGNNNGPPTPDIAAGQTLIFNDGNWTAEPTSFLQASAVGVTALAANGDVYIQGRLKVVGNIVLPTGLTIDQATITNSDIDNSPIGAVTPSTGAFTTLTASTSVIGGGVLSGTDVLAVNGSSTFEAPVVIESGGVTNLTLRDTNPATTQLDFSTVPGNPATISATGTGANNNLVIQANSTTNSNITIEAGAAVTAKGLGFVVDNNSAGLLVTDTTQAPGSQQVLNAPAAGPVTIGTTANPKALSVSGNINNDLVGTSPTATFNNVTVNGDLVALGNTSRVHANQFLFGPIPSPLIDNATATPATNGVTVWTINTGAPTQTLNIPIVPLPAQGQLHTVVCIAAAGPGILTVGGAGNLGLLGTAPASFGNVQAGFTATLMGINLGAFQGWALISVNP